MRKILIFVAIAICLVCARNDASEGAIIRLFAVLVLLRMIFLYMEVIRDEIIQALKKTDAK